MKLKELLKNIIEIDLPENFTLKEIPTIVCDSRCMVKDSLFVTLPGTNAHGIHFIDEAIQKGAAVVVTEHKFVIPILEKNKNICVLGVNDPVKFLKEIMVRFYGDPSQKVKTIGVTGTNGKTTITYLLESIFTQAQQRCGVIGTINYRIGKKILSSKNTTPGLIENQMYLSELAREGIKYCAMEVSSHALDQGRVDLIDFSTAIFTNLTGDHLDYHRDMEQYFRAKSILFKHLLSKAGAVINVDDRYGPRLMETTKAKVLTYGIVHPADVRAVEIKMKLTGSEFMVISPQGRFPIKTRLIGEHNIYNILACTAAVLSQGLGVEQIKKGVEALESVPGRLEKVAGPADLHVYVDYAHTEDALKNVLRSIKRVSLSRIILVFGCGGNRDKTKRPKMGKAASLLADWSIVTSDNPRNEDPEAIIAEIAGGFLKENYEVMIDRREAIVKALSLAQKNDVVLIAGKGHENYQIFKDQTISFDDREVVRSYFEDTRDSHQTQGEKAAGV